MLFVVTTAMLLSACQPEAIETQEVASPSEVVIAPEENEIPEGDTNDGGTIIYAFPAEPDTLDCLKTANDFSEEVCGTVGGSLVARDPGTGAIVPYLAESWDISQDGLTYTFHIKDWIKFHDGTPFTAYDYAFTLNRALSPETGSPGTASLLGTLAIAEAIDDLTLVLHLAAPNAILFENLANPGYMMPFSQAYVEATDEDFLARNPMSVGPYIFKEWVAGEHIIVERNPDYTWGPEYGTTEPYDLESIEFRFIPDEMNVLSGLEAGEIDLFTTSNLILVQQLDEHANFTIKEQLDFSVMAVLINTSMEIFQDVRIRKALNYAINREAIVEIVLGGSGVPAYGPISPAVYGYDDTLEETGFGYAPDKAKALLEELGYTLNTEGFYEKDGEVLGFILNTMDETETNVRLVEVLQQQYEEAGIDIEIQVMEFGQAISGLMSMTFELTSMKFGMPNASILNLIFSPASIGGGLFMPLDVKKMNHQLAGIDTIVDPNTWLENVQAAQQTIIADLALIVPIYHEKEYLIVSKDFEGVVFSNFAEVVLDNTYYTGE
jgi:peptide/nickel transport system substrate-binding protein